MMTKRIRMDSGAPVYHCIGRIVGGELLLGDEEKEHFRRLMWRVARFSGVEIITYCVMSNHVHLLVRIPTDQELSDEEICRRLVAYYGKREPWVQLLAAGVKAGGSLPLSTRQRLLARMGDVSMFMRTLKQRFSKWYNRKHKRFGTLWAERFKSVLVEDDDEALQVVAMYIDLNPVRAGLVKDPKDYRFCGHAEAVVGNQAIRRSTVQLCEASTWRKACTEHRRRMMVAAEESGNAKKVSLSREEIIRVWKRGGELELAEVLKLRLRYLSDGVVFGSREFVEEVYDRFRDRFGQNRTTGARQLRIAGRSLRRFATVRDLKKAAVG